MAFIVCLIVTLFANGFFVTSSAVATTGCWVGLDRWYTGLCALAGIKLAVQGARLAYFYMHCQDSITIHVGGNFILMPLLTVALFTVSVKMFKIPYPTD